MMITGKEKLEPMRDGRNQSNRKTRWKKFYAAVDGLLASIECSHITRSGHGAIDFETELGCLALASTRRICTE